jgi:radical SAM protein with 4Fe4S-binding SPASM domain
MKQRLETVKDCTYPWTWMMVASDGRIMPCCFATHELGNLNEASPEAIWNGPIAVDLRASIKRNEVHSICKGAICKFVQNMKIAGSDRN